MADAVLAFFFHSHEESNIIFSPESFTIHRKILTWFVRSIATFNLRVSLNHKLNFIHINKKFYIAVFNDHQSE